LVVGRVDPLGDPLRHDAGAVPHGVVEDGDAVFLVFVSPLEIPLHHLEGVLPPDHAVAGADEIHRQLKAEHLVDLLGHQRAVRGDDVGVILESLLPEFARVDQIVEHQCGGIVLTEGVTGEKDVVLGQVAEHGVRPVEHGGLDKDQFLAVAQVEAVAGLDHPEIPVLVILPLDRFHPVGRAVDGLLRDARHQLRQGAAVVHLAVAGDDEVDPVQLDPLGQIGDEFLVKRGPDRIDERHLLLFDKIGVVAGAAMGRKLVAVEFAQFPVDLADP
jgi:hypothetical protein